MEIYVDGSMHDVGCTYNKSIPDFGNDGFGSFATLSNIRHSPITFEIL